MLSWLCPEEVNICTELSSGRGRRLPCYNTNQHIIIVREEISLNLPEQQDDTVEGNGTELCAAWKQGGTESEFDSGGA